jgi:hypothetical protein
MNEQFKGFIAGLRDNIEKIRSYNEDTVKQGVILPCLHNLGWEVFDTEEVKPEYSIDNKRVDYALRLDNKNKIFLEAKKPYEDLDRHQEQLLMYAFKQSIKVAILTNGLTWQFYLPMQESENWRERRCYTIDIVSQDIESIIEKCIALLSKDNVKSGVAFNNAEKIFKGEQRKVIVAETLPEAWNKVISDPDSLIVDLLAEVTEKICGFKPESEEVVKFISNNEEKFIVIQEEDGIDYDPTNMKVRREERAHNPNIPQKSRNDVDEGNITQEDLESYIIRALQEMGGKAQKKDVDDKIYKQLIEYFTAPYYQEKSGQTIRWKHFIAWSKERLKAKGIIKRPIDSGRGIWELTDEGKKFRLG